MRRKWFLGILLCITLFGMVFTAEAAPRENFERVVLKNGVTLKFKVIKNEPMVSIYAVFPIGSHGEKAKGIAHLLEHLVFRGGSGLTFKDISEVTTKKGGYFNGFTSFYATAYNYVVPKEHYEKALEVFNGCIWGVTLAPPIVEMEKQIIGHELNMNYSLQYRFYPLVRYFYPERYHSKETMAQITVDDLRSFHKTYYQPDNVTYVIAGDIDPKKVIAQLEQVENQSGYMKAPQVPVSRLDFPVGEIVEERNLYPYQYQLMMGYVLEGLTEKERMAVKLLSYMYGSDYKIDYLKNRYKVYNAISRSVGDQDYFGLFYLERNEPYSEDAVEREKANILRYFHEFKQVDFKRAVKNFIGLIELEARQSQSSAVAAVEYEVQRLSDPDNLTVDSLTLLRKLTEKDLLEVIDKYFSKPPTTWVLVKTTR